MQGRGVLPHAQGLLATENPKKKPLPSILSKNGRNLSLTAILTLSASCPVVTVVIVLNWTLAYVRHIVAQVPKPGALNTSVVRQLLGIVSERMLKMLRVMDASDANVAPAALQHKGSSMTGMMQRNDIALPQSLTTLRARNVLHRAAGLWPSLVQVPPYSAHHPILEAVAAKTVRAPCESWIVNHSFTKHANELLATVRVHKLLWVNFLLFWAAGRPCRKACKVLRILVRDLI